MFHMQLHVSEKSKCCCLKMKIQLRFSQELTLTFEKNAVENFLFDKLFAIATADFLPPRFIT